LRQFQYSFLFVEHVVERWVIAGVDCVTGSQQFTDIIDGVFRECAISHIECISRFQYGVTILLACRKLCGERSPHIINGAAFIRRCHILSQLFVTGDRAGLYGVRMCGGS
jgi:hypothetical protein